MCLLSNTCHNKAEVIIKLALNTNQLIILSNFFDISDFSLDSWISKNNLPQNLDPLPQWAVERLMQKWGVSQFNLSRLIKSEKLGISHKYFKLTKIITSFFNKV
jgi:hypothetical protein